MACRLIVLEYDLGQHRRCVVAKAPMSRHQRAVTVSKLLQVGSSDHAFEMAEREVAVGSHVRAWKGVDLPKKSRVFSRLPVMILD